MSKFSKKLFKGAFGLVGAVTGLLGMGAPQIPVPPVAAAPVAGPVLDTGALLRVGSEDQAMGPGQTTAGKRRAAAGDPLGGLGTGAGLRL